MNKHKPRKANPTSKNSKNKKQKSKAILCVFFFHLLVVLFSPLFACSFVFVRIAFFVYRFVPLVAFSVCFCAFWICLFLILLFHMFLFAFWIRCFFVFVFCWFLKKKGKTIRDSLSGCLEFIIVWLSCWVTWISR